MEVILNLRHQSAAGITNVNFELITENTGQ